MLASKRVVESFDEQRYRVEPLRLETRTHGDQDAERLDGDPDKYFPGFPLGFVPEVAFDPANRPLLYDPLYDDMFGVGLGEQPSRPDVYVDLDTLVDTLMIPCPPLACSEARTLTMAKGVCAAMLASAAVTIH